MYYFIDRDSSGAKFYGFSGIELEEIRGKEKEISLDEWKEGIAPRGKYAQVEYEDGRCYLIDLDEISAGNGCGIIKELPELDEDYYPYLPQDKIYPVFEKYSLAKAIADENWRNLTLCIIERKNGEDEGKVRGCYEAPQASWWYPNLEEDSYEVIVEDTDTDRIARDAAEFILDNQGLYEEIQPRNEEFFKKREVIENKLYESIPKPVLSEAYILDLDFDGQKFDIIDQLDLDSAQGYDERNSRRWRISIQPRMGR